MGVHTYTAPSTGASPYVVTVAVVKNATAEFADATANVSASDALLFPFTQKCRAWRPLLARLLSSGAVAQFTDNNPFVTPAKLQRPGCLPDGHKLG